MTESVDNKLSEVSIKMLNDWWEEDSKLDWDTLEKTTLDQHQLHHKYYKVYEQEKWVWDTLLVNLENATKWRREFYLGKLSQDKLKDFGWLEEAKEIGGRKILKNEVDQFLSCDKVLEPIRRDVAVVEIKIAKLKEICDMIKWRHQTIKVALEIRKFKEGL